MKPKLEVNIGKLKLKNPIIAASGTFGYGREHGRFFDIKKLGAITTKTITLKPRLGNKPPRIIETPAGMLNSIGLQNEGIEDFIKNKVYPLRKKGITLIVSIGAERFEEYKIMSEMLSDVRGVLAIELNISCPNIEYGSRGGALFAQDEFMVERIVKSVRKATGLPLITKLSPNVTDIKIMAKASVDGGTDAISLVNTFYGMSIDIKSRRSNLANIKGGLSGPCIKPIACFMINEVFNKVNVPIIGMGGIMDSSDAIEFIIAGATAISVGTANFINPGACLDILEGIKEFMVQNKICSIKNLIGSLEAKDETS